LLFSHFIIETLSRAPLQRRVSYSQLASNAQPRSLRKAPSFGQEIGKVVMNSKVPRVSAYRARHLGGLFQRARYGP
jgi:hypothetical protein